MLNYVFKSAHTLSPHRIKQSNQISTLFLCQNLRYCFALARGNLATCYSPQACFHTIAIRLKCSVKVFIKSSSPLALGNERQYECAVLLSGKGSHFVSWWKSLVYHTLRCLCLPLERKTAGVSKSSFTASDNNAQHLGARIKVVQVPRLSQPFYI